MPVNISTVEQQEQRVREALARASSGLAKYVELADLHDRNEVLFYRLLLDDIEQLMPVVYTPTVGEASLNFSHIFRRGRGRWVCPEHRGRISEVLETAVQADIRLIVVTDNERILGLGDQGAGGMTIPVGKLTLYTAGAGIHPSHTLPISLDVGTDNEALLGDPMYLGWRHPRLRGDRYYAFIDEFVDAVKECFPNALLQWEDFKKTNAFFLLERYRDRILSFNDDIQGTAAVTVAGMLAACRLKGEQLSDQRVLMMGSGAAGVGITSLLHSVLENQGVPREQIVQSVALLDTGGLLLSSRDYSDEYKNSVAWPDEKAHAMGLVSDPIPQLADVVAAYKPTILVGTTGEPGVFTEPIVREMAAHVERPIIFPLSNPTSKTEATPADLVRWTNGRAICATGSPFDPVEHEGVTHYVSQANNVYVFPGVGLGALAAGASKVTDAMFTAAARALAEQLTERQLAAGQLYPSLRHLREVTRAIGEAVAQQAIDDGVATEPEQGVAEAVNRWIWEPEYPEIRVV